MAREFAKSFYNSKEWKKCRELIMIRDSYLCVLCNKPAQEVHHKKHITPNNINNPAITLNPENLISLCGDCHKKIHAGEQTNQQESILPLISFDEDGNPVIV